MAVTVTLAQVSTNVVAGRDSKFTVTVANSGASSLTLTSLSVVELSGTGATVGQPQYLVPNVPVGTGNPTLTASGSLTYGFQATFTNPNACGPSPQNPGGASAIAAAQPADPFFVLQAQGQTSDGSVFSGSLFVTVLAPVNNDPIPQGGALWLMEGANFMNFLTQFA